MRGTLDSLRRLGSGAVLAFCSAFLACGGDGRDLAGPEVPEPTPPADEGVTPAAGCSEGALEHGALYRICFPEAWNGNLALYAHGYVAAHRPVALPDDVIGGQSISGTLTGMGYAFATTSYRANGLVAPEAVEDLVELEATVRRLYRPDPGRSVIIGFSEGGLVATLATERHPELFDGAVAGCGPIGDFGAQLNYIGDFRVVFDYLFPGVLPGSAVEIPQSLQDRWDEVYIPAIVLALAVDFEAASELMRVTGAPVAGNDLRSMAETTIGILWYNVFGTADAQARLGGQPFDNSARAYAGSSNDAALNAGVARFAADPDAIPAIGRFETSGNLEVPLVTMHTTGDQIVPFSQAQLYGDKASRAGAAGRLTALTVERHGHCTFEVSEVLGAFADLMDDVKPAPAGLLAVLAER
ncbi:MAG: alpha/beta hydrolase family protein [Gemmatimonadales bacterium]